MKVSPCVQSASPSYWQFLLQRRLMSPCRFHGTGWRRSLLCPTCSQSSGSYPSLHNGCFYFCSCSSSRVCSQGESTCTHQGWHRAKCTCTGKLVVVSRTKLYFYQSRLFTKSGWSECFSTSSFNMKVATAGVIHSLACTPKIITRDVTKRSNLH